MKAYNIYVYIFYKFEFMHFSCRNMETLREDRNDEPLDNAEDVDLKKIRKGNSLFYVDGKNNVYDRKSFLQKFEKSFVSKLKAKMSDELKKTTQAFIGSIVEIMFSEFEGKKVGDEFSVDDCVAKLMEKFEINIDVVPNDSEEKKKKKNEKQEKVKKPRKKSGYNIFFAENKDLLNTKREEIAKETGEKPPTPVTVAGSLWKALSDKEKKVYNDKAAALE